MIHIYIQYVIARSWGCWAGWAGVPALGPCKCCGPWDRLAGRRGVKAEWVGRAGKSWAQSWGRGLVQFPRSFVLKCARRGSALTPAIVPEASIPPSPVAPTGQDDGCNFSVGFIARRCVGRGEGYPLREPLWKLGGWGDSLAWALELSAQTPQMVL